MEAAAGFGRISVAQGLGALQMAVLPHAPSPLGVMRVQWQRMLGGDLAVPAFLADMAPSSAAVGACAPASTQHAASGVSLELVLELVKLTAGGAIDADVPLMDSGMDSLAATELGSQLSGLAGAELSSTLIFEHATARAISSHMAALAVSAGRLPLERR